MLSCTKLEASTTLRCYNFHAVQNEWHTTANEQGTALPEHMFERLSGGARALLVMLRIRGIGDCFLAGF